MSVTIQCSFSAVKSESTDLKSKKYITYGEKVINPKLSKTEFKFYLRGNY